MSAVGRQEVTHDLHQQQDAAQDEHRHEKLIRLCKYCVKIMDNFSFFEYVFGIDAPQVDARHNGENDGQPKNVEAVENRQLCVCVCGGCCV